MKTFFAYVRVSTVRQGEHGVSLQEQRDAIERFASQNRLSISEWFEERETAALRGRPVFSEMLRRLKARRAAGVIIHKIDRSSRNLKDWADLGELIDHGLEIQFANESLDLNSRGGRLSADIQAVVAADFIRNLKEETRKGIRGRLKQGIYPLPAPLGYLDQGSGKPKVPDPAKAPLIRQAFELYATEQHNLRELRHRMTALGLRNRNEKQLSLTGLATVLSNPFYVGLMRMKSSQEVFPGIHQPLIATALFNRVQAILKGKTNTKSLRHNFLYRRLLTCASCGRSLIGELQKGHVYYRCQIRSCPVTCIREESVDSYVRDLLSRLVFSSQEKGYFVERVSVLRRDVHKQCEDRRIALNLRLAQLDARLARLTDAYIERLIEKDLFEQRKNGLLLERRQLQEDSAAISAEELSIEDQVCEYLELAGTASFLYEMALADEKRELLKILTSNRRASGKKLDFTLNPPFQTIANRSKNANGSPQRYIPRTLDEFIDRLVIIIRDTPLELFDRISDFLSRKRNDDPVHSSPDFH